MNDKPKPQSVEELMDFAEKQARAIIEEKGDEAQSMFLAQTLDNQMLVIAALWANEYEKVQILEGVKKLFKEKNVDRYVHISEAWASSNMQRHEQGFTPSQDPDRREVLIILGVDRNRVLHRSWEIETEGEIRKIGTMKMLPEGTKITGRMTELLDTRNLN